MQRLENQATPNVVLFVDDEYHLYNSMPNVYHLRLVDPRASNLPCLVIPFQNGALKDHPVNGIQIEDLLAIIQNRLTYFQNSPFACEENETAKMYVNMAHQQLKNRTADRKLREVEGEDIP